MRDILPPEVFSALRDRYLAGVADAEFAFEQHQADEDSVTGGLGQALATREPMLFVHGGTEYAVRISYRKLRGRGKNAPERIFGSDGLFQISVEDAFGRVVRRKGLPFQSKMNWRGKRADLLRQATLMEQLTPGGIVIDFSPSGYSACSAKAAIAAGGSRRQSDRFGSVRPLGQILSRDFLECTIGTRGLYFDPKQADYIFEDGEEEELGPYLITTAITVRVERDAS